MRLIIAGKRDFSDKKYVYAHISNFIFQNGLPDEIISGGANGVDGLAKEYARDNDYIFKEFPANWSKYGKSAGPIRNEQMAEYASKDKGACLLAFWDGKSKGTQSMIKIAEKYKIKVKIITI